MMVVWGTKLYGKVDEIEGLGHVATQFGHVFWLPLIPLNSYFVTDKGKHEFDGTPLGLQMKSVLVGYTRVFSILFFFAGLGAINTLFGPHEVADPEKIGTYKTMICLGIFSIPAFVLTRLRTIRFANYETATQLANRLGFDQKLRTYIDFYYDKIDKDEAEKRMGDVEDRTSNASQWDGDDEIAAAYQRYMTT